ncbi:methyltransferase domain-containing protein [Longimicrobium terrae]|uniref:SAM-dependent methyltransferase n=1 Tax=Longimicrobium terrae TaxID=1639882 RepID=A0A841GW23_9BACT|nr:SAM-dependent methyltransferase [Longimicrobium terrae]MBB6070118.1 SAM-dependent methyltransferase [Longimicrobium terrae]NNC33021.1 class I SAM-dependent methyltransferase [Longimicrobium terrae]
MTQPDADRIAEGEYARKQLSGRAGLIGWSHERRFRTARGMVAPYAARRLLDYGCGDGTFLAQVHDLFPAATGVEVDDGLVRDARARFAPVGGLEFVHTGDVDRLPAGAFGVVTCMEVLEHCTPDSVDGVVAQIRRLAAPDAAVIISVPVETGPALLVKQAARAAAGARGISGYQDREHYAPGELARMLVAGRGTQIDRPVYETAFADGSPNRYHGHKGFNWRALAARLERDFVIRRTRFSPLPLLGPLLNSQAWMLCSPR